MKKKTVYGELYLESQGFGDEWRGDSIKSFGNTAFRRLQITKLHHIPRHYGAIENRAK